MSKVVTTLKILLIDALMLEAILLLFMGQIWIQKSCIAKTARSRNIQYSYTGYKGLDMLSVMCYTNLNITNSLNGVVRWTSKQTHQDLRQNRVNYTLIHLNILTVKMTTKQIPTSIYSGSIISIRNSIQKSIKKPVKTEASQFVYIII